MEKVFDWSAPLIAASSRMLQGFLDYLPQLIGALVVLLLGWLIAKGVKALTLRMGRSFDRVPKFIRFGRISPRKQVNDSVLIIISNVAFWLVILFFLTSATNLMGLTMFTGWLDQVINHLPNILSGALIIVAGIIVGNLVRDATRTAAQAMPARQRALLARGAQIFSMVTMIIIGVDQIGVNITVLLTVISIVIGTMLGGVAIAFGLGSKNLVSNLIGARYLNKDYRIGEKIRVGETEGTILELSSVSVILETSEGRLTIPAKLFSENSSLLVQQEADNVR